MDSSWETVDPSWRDARTSVRSSARSPPAPDCPVRQQRTRLVASKRFARRGTHEDSRLQPGNPDSYIRSVAARFGERAIAELPKPVPAPACDPATRENGTAMVGTRRNGERIAESRHEGGRRSRTGTSGRSRRATSIRIAQQSPAQNRAIGHQCTAVRLTRCDIHRIRNPFDLHRRRRIDARPISPASDRSVSEHPLCQRG
jgi:hypothetical protein